MTKPTNELLTDAAILAFEELRRQPNPKFDPLNDLITRFIPYTAVSLAVGGAVWRAVTADIPELNP